MTYYLLVEDNQIIGGSQFTGDNETIQDIEVTEEVYNDYIQHRDKYIYSDGAIVLNPNYEQQQADLRRAQFYGDFFSTSLGFIRRKVSMKTGETKDFLTDLLPVISMAVQNLQTVNIIAYKEPDFTQEITDWESLQEVKQATPVFIQECFNQVSRDFTGE